MTEALSKSRITV